MDNVKKDRIYKILSIIILLIMIIILCKYANKQSFELDELDWTIDYLAKANNLVELLQSLIRAGFNLPLYYITMFPIYKIMPFGEIWLLIPNFIAVIFGIYSVYKAGNKISDNLGFASLCVSAISYILIKQCAFELRPYAFLFCFSAYTLYRYICRLKESKKISNIVLYTISIVLLSFTHWFGCLIIVFYFLMDTILWLKKKNTISFIFPYLILGITFLPYFIITIINHTTDFANYWAQPPTIKDLLYKVFFFLLSNNDICVLLFIIGIIVLFTYIFRKNTETTASCISVLIGSIVWTLGTTFVYSKFINPNASLWVSRYFIVLLPHILIISAIPIAKLLCALNTMKIKDEKTGKISIKKFLIIYIIVLSIAMIACTNYKRLYLDVNSLSEPYRELSYIIANTPDVYEENCAVLTSSGKGYLTYYFENKGVQIPYNVFEAYTESSKTRDNMTKCVSEGKIVNSIDVNIEDLLKYDKLYLCEVHKGFDKEIADFITENYNFQILDQNLGFYLCVKKIQ